MGTLECIVLLILGLAVIGLIFFCNWLDYRYRTYKQDQMDRMEEELNLALKQVGSIQDHCIQEEARWSAGE